MLTFLRKIRKSLIESGSARKYLIYAIGEIALVVLGILIALYLNNWNNHRQNRKQEQQILHQLHDEFRANLEQLNEKIAFRDFLSDNTRMLLAAVDKKTKITSTDSINSWIASTLGTPTFDAAQGVSKELLQAGKLYLLRNDELRMLIASWESDVNQLAEEEQLFLKFGREEYTPFLIKNLRYRNIHHQFWDLQGAPNPGLSATVRQKMNLGRSQQTPQTLTFLSHPDLEDYLTEMMILHHVTNIQSQVLRKRIERILDLIDSCLT